MSSIRLGLDTTRRLLRRLGDPQLHVRTVSIAGTNGKGSTAAMVVAAAAAAGYRVGLFHSPSLGEDREQIEIHGRPLAPSTFDRYAARVDRGADDVRVDPSPFERLTVIAYLAFFEAGVDLAVVEAGLGGARDATNAGDPVVSALVSVGLDHRDHLGDSLAAIAREKAGIFRPGRPAVIGWLDAEALDAVLARAAAIGADVDPAAEHGPWTGPLGLAGAHQRQNAAIAARLLEHLRAVGLDRLDDAAVRRGLVTVRWPGRLEWLHTTPRPVLLDAAHNPAGASALARFLDAEQLRPDLIFGAFADKDAATMLATLRPTVGRVWLVPLDSPRSWQPREWAAEGDTIAADLGAALDAAFGRSTPLDPVLCTGSVFLIGAARRLLQARQREPRP